MSEWWIGDEKSKQQYILELEQQLAELRLQTTECNGFDCCPLAPELAELRERIHEACEVYAGMEGFIPVHAETGYVLQTIEQMYKELLGVQDELG